MILKDDRKEVISMEQSRNNINWYPGHMAKTKRQITEDVKLIDIVVELLDARIPISSQNPDIAKLIKGKKRIIALNKCDLADNKENQSEYPYLFRYFQYHASLLYILQAHMTQESYPHLQCRP